MCSALNVATPAYMRINIEHRIENKSWMNHKNDKHAQSRHLTLNLYSLSQYNMAHNTTTQDIRIRTQRASRVASGVVVHLVLIFVWYLLTAIVSSTKMTPLLHFWSRKKSIFLQCRKQSWVHMCLLTSSKCLITICFAGIVIQVVAE